MPAFSSCRGLLPAVAALAVAGSAAAQTWFPPPPTPAGNQATTEQILLGKTLFWDEQLSSSRTTACGTCHIFAAGATDPRSMPATHPGPDGVFGTADDIHSSPGIVRQDAAGMPLGDPFFGGGVQATTRQAPSPINAAYQSLLFWDGRATSEFRDPVTGVLLLPDRAALESQAAGPPTSNAEMGHVGRTWADIAADLPGLTPLLLAENLPADLQSFLAGGATYDQLFTQVYGSPGVTPARILFAIASYERTLIADQTRFDAWLAGAGTLTPAELAGFAVFQVFCIGCHTDLLPVSHAIGPAVDDFRNIGVRPEAEDTGRYGITGLATDYGAFKTPQLRNVELSAPYMHNGGLATLDQVMAFYNRGGDHGTNIDPMVVAMAGQLSPGDRANLVQFMLTLTDPRVAQELPPFDRPRLWSESARAPDTYGTGTPGSGGFAPQPVMVTPAFVGNGKFCIGVDDALPGAAHFVGLSFWGTTIPHVVFGHNLYLPLTTPLDFNGVTSSIAGSAPGTGFGAYALPIPLDPMLCGVPLCGQWLVVDPMGPAGASSSNMFRLTVF